MARHSPKTTTYLVSCFLPWDEGFGLDMETYTDAGTSNWISSSQGQAWTTPGGDYHATPAYSQYLDGGTEDVEIDISDLVEEWLDSTKGAYGVGIEVSSSFVSLPRSSTRGNSSLQGVLNISSSPEDL